MLTVKTSSFSSTNYKNKTKEHRNKVIKWGQNSTNAKTAIPVQLLSRVQPFATPWPGSMPGLPVPHQLQEFTQTHVHWVGDTIQPSHPLLSPSPPTFNLSQHQGLSQWVSSLHQVTKVLELQLQHQSFQWIFRVDFSLGLTGLVSLLSKGLSGLLQPHNLKHQFFGTQHSLWSNSHTCPGKTIALAIQTFIGKVTSLLFSTLSLS